MTPARGTSILTDRRNSRRLLAGIGTKASAMLFSPRAAFE
jgi:hypothetical protein